MRGTILNRAVDRTIYWRRFKKIRSFRHFKDSLDGFFQIVMKVKLSGRGAYRSEWLRHSREDFLDLDFGLTPEKVPLPAVLQDSSLLV